MSPAVNLFSALDANDEISCMQKAVDIAESALQAVAPLIKYGMEEKEPANELARISHQ